MGRVGHYLYKRSGSANWYLRLVNPPALAQELGRARTEMSLGTPDRIEAEALAAEHIAKHKVSLLAVERLRSGKMMPALGSEHLRYPANTTMLIDNVRVVATEDQLFFFGLDDSFLRAEPNRTEVSLANAIMLAMQHPGYLRRTSEMQLQRVLRGIKVAGSSAAMIGKTERILENWLERQNVGKHIEAEARAVWKLFGWLTSYKPLPQCNRSDAMLLVRHLQSTGNRSKTIAKKISHMSAAVQLAIDDGVFSGVNPFTRLLRRVGHDSDRRLPLSETDMARVREHLHELGREDRLLWVMLATTEMRLSEPFQATEEYESDELERIRYIIVGTKTRSSCRRVPLPDEVKRLLGRRIRGPIFTDSPETHAKRLRRFLQRLDISFDPKRGTGDRRKTIHSLRHRAADRLREAGCEDSIREALLGHELISVADGYGQGYPVGTLRHYQGRIGY